MAEWVGFCAAPHAGAIQVSRLDGPRGLLASRSQRQRQRPHAHAPAELGQLSPNGDTRHAEPEVDVNAEKSRRHMHLTSRKALSTACGAERDSHSAVRSCGRDGGGSPSFPPQSIRFGPPPKFARRGCWSLRSVRHATSAHVDGSDGNRWAEDRSNFGGGKRRRRPSHFFLELFHGRSFLRPRMVF